MLVYFKNAPLPPQVDLAAVEALRAFKEHMKKEGLLGEYGTSMEIARLVERHLTSVVVELQASSDATALPGKVDRPLLTAPIPDVRVYVDVVTMMPDVRRMGDLL